MKTVRQYINSFKEKVIDKWGRTHMTHIEWVDELPKERELWHEDEPSDYRGFRNMEQGCFVKRVNPFIALEKTSYNAGPKGYCYYTSTLYVRKDIWRNFHMGCPVAAPTYQIHKIRIRIQVSEDSGYYGVIYSRALRLMELERDSYDAAEQRLHRLAKLELEKLQKEFKKRGLYVQTPFGGEYTDVLYSGDVDFLMTKNSELCYYKLLLGSWKDSNFKKLNIKYPQYQQIYIKLYF